MRHEVYVFLPYKWIYSVMYDTRTSNSYVKWQTSMSIFFIFWKITNYHCVSNFGKCTFCVCCEFVVFMLCNSYSILLLLIWEGIAKNLLKYRIILARLEVCLDCFKFERRTGRNRMNSKALLCCHSVYCYLTSSFAYLYFLHSHTVFSLFVSFLFPIVLASSL